MQARHQGRELVARLEPGDLRQDRCQRPAAAGIDRVGVHAGGEVVAYLALDRIAIGRRVGGRLQDAPEVLEVVVGQLGVDVPAGAVGRYRIVRDPSAAGVLVEVVAGVHRAVHGGRIEPRPVGEFPERPRPGVAGEGGPGKQHWQDQATHRGDRLHLRASSLLRSRLV